MILISEHASQVALVSWLEQTYPDLWFFAIPNGGKRGKLEAKRLKDEGVQSGVPDLMIPALRLFIEMKRADGGVESANQKKWRDYLNGCGYAAVVCKGHGEAIKIIVDMMENST